MKKSRIQEVIKNEVRNYIREIEDPNINYSLIKKAIAERSQAHVSDMEIMNTSVFRDRIKVDVAISVNPGETFYPTAIEKYSKFTVSGIRPSGSNFVRLVFSTDKVDDFMQ